MENDHRRNRYLDIIHKLRYLNIEMDGYTLGYWAGHGMISFELTIKVEYHQI